LKNIGTNKVPMAEETNVPAVEEEKKEEIAVGAPEVIDSSIRSVIEEKK